MAVIFYLSGTGNSLYAAQKAQAVLPDCRLENIGSYLQKPYQVDDKVVGIVCPVYCFALPPVVADFVQQLQAAPEYCFAIVTMGANAGFALKQLRQLLAIQGIKLDYAQDIAMPDNFFAVPEFVRSRMLAAAEPKLAAVQQKLSERVQNTECCRSAFLWEHGGTAVGWKFICSVLRADKPQADMTKCIGCGICERICPMGNITMEGSRPVFGSNCAVCLGCLHWCPVSAVHAGRKTINKKSRYINPNVSMEEMDKVGK